MAVRINLLPVKASRRQNSARQELYGVVAAIALALGGIFLWNSAISGDVDKVNKRIAGVKSDLKALEKDRARVKSFQKKTKLLKKKKEVIKKLEKQKIGPAKLLDDLATILTTEKKVWLTSLSEDEGSMVLKGGAMENVNISDFQLALRRNSKFFKDVELVVVSRGKEKGASKGGPKIEFLNWEIRCKADYSAGS